VTSSNSRSARQRTAQQIGLSRDRRHEEGSEIGGRRTCLLDSRRILLVDGVHFGLESTKPPFVGCAAVGLALRQDADKVLDLLGLADEVGQELALRGLDDRPRIGVGRLEGDGQVRVQRLEGWPGREVRERRRRDGEELKGEECASRCGRERVPTVGATARQETHVLDGVLQLGQSVHVSVGESQGRTDARSASEPSRTCGFKPGAKRRATRRTTRGLPCVGVSIIAEQHTAERSEPTDLAACLTSRCELGGELDGLVEERRPRSTICEEDERPASAARAAVTNCYGLSRSHGRVPDVAHLWHRALEPAPRTSSTPSPAPHPIPGLPSSLGRNLARRVITTSLLIESQPGNPSRVLRTPSPPCRTRSGRVAPPFSF